MSLFVGTAYSGGGTPFIVASTAQFQTSAPLASSASFTVGLGPADATRIVVACAWICNQLGSPAAVSSVTIDGGAGTLGVAAGPTSAANVNRSSNAIYYRALATGTSITVSVASTANTNQFFGVHCFSIYRARNSSPSDTDSVGTGGSLAGSISVSATIPAGGLYIVSGASTTGATPATVNYANGDTDNNSATFTGWHGYDVKQSAATPTFTRSPASGNFIPTMTMVTWR